MQLLTIKRLGFPTLVAHVLSFIAPLACGAACVTQRRNSRLSIGCDCDPLPPPASHPLDYDDSISQFPHAITPPQNHNIRRPTVGTISTIQSKGPLRKSAHFLIHTHLCLGKCNRRAEIKWWVTHSVVTFGAEEMDEKRRGRGGRERKERIAGDVMTFYEQGLPIIACWLMLLPAPSFFSSQRLLMVQSPCLRALLLLLLLLLLIIGCVCMHVRQPLSLPASRDFPHHSLPLSLLLLSL